MGMYDGVIQAAPDGTASPRAAIKANCLQCTHLNVDEIRHCTVKRCALHKYRPYQT